MLLYREGVGHAIKEICFKEIFITFTINIFQISDISKNTLILHINTQQQNHYFYLKYKFKLMT